VDKPRPTVLNMDSIDINALERILPLVEKPGRYTGGELNQIVKNWQEISIKIALAFPDIYDLGMSNLGLAILYDQINQRRDSLAERVYAPWLDMEHQLRNADIPLYSLETKHPLAAFDIIGFTLPYETLYTNALNMLDLAQIPLRSSERNETHPLIIAGGQAVYNPEPMYAFIDAFVIGEGEGVIHEIIQTYSEWKESKEERSLLLKRLSTISGVYVPSFYLVQQEENGEIIKIENVAPDIPFPINKRIVSQLPPPPTRFIVPYIDVTHNRITIEIMRGCTRGCRFCHAGMVNRPVRERSVKEIISAIQEALNYTGLEEVGLLSLSSSDYTHISELLHEISKLQSTEWFNSQRLSISLPSLRIESFTEDVINALQDSRRHGFTLAPEAATERLRSTINKSISSQQLLNMVKEIYQRGFTTIKLYFMIGHPGETLEDVEAIADLCKQALTEGRILLGGRAKINVGINTFVPKPHTPFQWTACDTTESILEKQALLRRRLRDRNIKLTWNDPRETILEASLSRGDRRLSDVIYYAWEKGAKFDAWQDQFRYSIWLEAFEKAGRSPDEYLYQERSVNETLPWDHIQAGINKKFLIQDYAWSREGKTRQDCRLGCYACGISHAYTEVFKQTCQKITKSMPQE